MSVTYRDNHNDHVLLTTVYHGGKLPPAGSHDLHTLNLDKDEYITSYFARTWKKKFGNSHRTRVSLLNLSTNKSKGIVCGPELGQGESI